MTPVDGKTTDIRIMFRAGEFEKFYNNLNTRIRSKFEYTSGLVRTIYALPVEHMKHLGGTSLYEMRVFAGSSKYRTVLFAIDNSNVILSTKIILLNNFLKKSTEDYDKQIAKAVRVLKDLAL